MTFCRTFLSPFSPKRVEDLPEFILREEGWRAKGLTRGNRLSFTRVLTNDVIITRSGLISFFWCVGYSSFVWHWSCQCYSKHILLNEGMGTLALPRRVPIGNQQHLVQHPLCLGFHTPKQVHLQPHNPSKQSKQGAQHIPQLKVPTFGGYFCNWTNPNTLSKGVIHLKGADVGELQVQTTCHRFMGLCWGQSLRDFLPQMSVRNTGWSLSPSPLEAGLYVFERRYSKNRAWCSVQSHTQDYLCIPPCTLTLCQVGRAASLTDPKTTNSLEKVSKMQHPRAEHQPTAPLPKGFSLLPSPYWNASHYEWQHWSYCICTAYLNCYKS